MIRNREYTKALLSGRQARLIAGDFMIPFDIVCEDRARLRANRERAREKMRLRAQSRRDAIRKPSGAISREWSEVTQREEQRQQYEAWRSLPIVYENDHRSRPWDERQAVANTMRLMRVRPQAASYAGVSDIYDERGMDFHAGSKAA